MGKSIYDKDYRQIIERLKKARIDAGLSQQAVADKMKKPQSYISKTESGERRLDVAEMKKFTKLYNKDINYFIK
jgi:transcriptional regulator with XRE-family HTH domain